MNTEQGRITHILEKAQKCAIQENLAKARAYMGNEYSISKSSGITSIPLESTYLTSQLNCYNYVKPPVVPESVRIAMIQQNTLLQEVNPMDPNTRFSDYAPAATIFPCPPPNPNVFNGNLPKTTGFCQLPNSPLNPSLPI